MTTQHNTTQHNTKWYLCLFLLFLFGQMKAQKIPYYETKCNSVGVSKETAASKTEAPLGVSKTVYIKVAVHFLLPTHNINYNINTTDAQGKSIVINYSGAGNFTETSDGNQGSYTGFQYAEDLINNANALLDNNVKPYRVNPSYTNDYYDPTKSNTFSLCIGCYTFSS